jgi:hypothetical protein
MPGWIARRIDVAIAFERSCSQTVHGFRAGLAARSSTSFAVDSQILACTVCAMLTPFPRTAVVDNKAV